MTMTHILCSTAVGLVLASSAMAETPARAWTDLNLRAGPNTSYPIIAVIPATQEVTVDGCLEAATWCRVKYDGVDGWASGDYLTAMVEQPITVQRERLAVKTITYDQSGEAAVGGGVAGAVAGAIVAGPVGALVGAAIGATTAAAATPPETVTTYVRSNPLDPIYLDGEVVVGAGVPDPIKLTEVPDSDYYYAYINGLPVLIERKNRRVVYIMR